MAYLTQCIKGGSSYGHTGWLIKFDYDRQILAELKRIHPSGREWDLDNKVWWISEVYDNELNELFSNWYSLAKSQGTLL